MQCQFACRQMDEYQAGMDQIKGLSRYWIGDNVVALDLNRGLGKRSVLYEEARVDVGDQDMTAGTAALCQPGPMPVASRWRMVQGSLRISRLVKRWPACGAAFSKM